MKWSNIPRIVPFSRATNIHMTLPWDKETFGYLPFRSNTSPERPEYLDFFRKRGRPGGGEYLSLWVPQLKASCWFFHIKPASEDYVPLVIKSNQAKIMLFSMRENHKYSNGKKSNSYIKNYIINI